MKQSIKALLMANILILSGNAIAAGQLISHNRDIINSSNIPATITYKVCEMGGDQQEVTGCKEKTITLGEKGSKTNKVSIDASFAALHSKGDHIDSMHGYNQIIFISKIVSALGQQTFATFETNEYEDYKNDARYHWRTCMLTALGPEQNVIILDTLGTDKFYCQPTFQIS